MFRFPEREPGETDDQWQVRIREQYTLQGLEQSGKEPSSGGPVIPRFLRQPTFGPLVLLVAGVTGAGVMWVYNRLSTPPTVSQSPVAAEVRSPIQLSIVSSGELTLTTPELVRTVKRVADMEQFLKKVLIYPDIKINTAGTGLLDEKELAKLIIDANISDRVATWKFNDPNNIYNLTVSNTYENDGRLSQRSLILGLSISRAEPSRSYVDRSGLIPVAYLDVVRRAVLRVPYYINTGPSSVNHTDGTTSPSRRGVGIDPDTGTYIEVWNDTIGLISLWEREPFYTNPG